MENEYVSACKAFFNVIQRLRLKSAFLYTKIISYFDHDETYKLGHGPRTNSNHVHIFRLCKSTCKVSQCNMGCTQDRLSVAQQ